VSAIKKAFRMANTFLGSPVGSLATNLLGAQMSASMAPGIAGKTTAAQIAAQQAAGIYGGGGPAGPAGGAPQIGAAPGQATIATDVEQREKDRKNAERIAIIQAGGNPDDPSHKTLPQVQGEQVKLAIQHATKLFGYRRSKMSSESLAATYMPLQALLETQIGEAERVIRANQAKYSDPKSIGDAYSNIWRSLANLADDLGIDPAVFQSALTLLGYLGAAAGFKFFLKKRKGNKGNKRIEYGTDETVNYDSGRKVRKYERTVEDIGGAGGPQ